MARAARRLAIAAAWFLLCVGCLLLSAYLHLNHRAGLRLAASATNTLVSGEIAGRLAIGRVESIGLERIVTRHVALYDPTGERVIVADRVEIVPDLDAAKRGVLRFSHAELDRGTLRLIAGQKDLPTFIEAFQPTRPPPAVPRPGIEAIVDDIHLADVTAYGEVLGVEGLRVENLRAHGRLHVNPEGIVDVRIFSADGDVVAPWNFVGKLDRVVARINTDPHEGTTLAAIAHTPGEGPIRPEEGEDATRPRVGGDHARVQMRFAVPVDEPADADAELDLRIHADPVHPELLDELGFSWAGALRGPARGYVRFYGKPTDLKMNASLDTEGGALEVAAALPAEGQAKVDLRTRSLSVADVIPGAPDVKVEGEVAIKPGEEGSRFEANLEPFQFESLHIPAMVARGTIGEEGIQLDDARGRYGSTKILASGKVGYDGSVELRLHADAGQIGSDKNLREMLPGARGRLKGDVEIQRDAEGNMGYRFDLLFSPFHYGPIDARWLRARGTLHGDPSEPIITADVSGEGFLLGGYLLGKGTGRIQGGPHSFETQGAFDAPGERHLDFTARVDRRGEEITVHGDRIVLAVADSVWRGSTGKVVYRPGFVGAEGVYLQNREQRFYAAGVWNRRGPDALAAQLTHIDLADLRAFLPFPTPETNGAVDMDLNVTGDFDEMPRVEASGYLYDASFREVQSLSGDYHLLYDGGSLELRSQADLAAQGKLELHALGLIDTREDDPIEALRLGIFEVALRIDDLDLEVIRPWLPEALPAYEGHATGKLSFSGAIDAPSFIGELQMPRLQIDEWPELDTYTEFNYSQGVLSGRVSTADEHGPLLETEAALMIDLISLAQSPDLALEMLSAAPWRVSFRVTDREVSKLPAPIADSLPTSLENLDVSLSATFAGGALKTHGDVFASVEWREDPNVARCAIHPPPRATFIARVADGKTEIEGAAVVGGRPSIRFQAQTATPIDAWLNGDLPETLPPLDLRAQLSGAPAEGVPGLCEVAAGPLDGAIEIANLFGDSPVALADLTSPGMSIRRFDSRRRGTASRIEVETPPTPLELRVEARDAQASLALGASWWNGGQLYASSTLALLWGGEVVVPELDPERDLSLQVTLNGMPLQAPLAFFSSVDDVGGLVDGTITINGNMEDADVQGRLHVSDGSLDLTALGQRLHDISGDVIVRDGALHLEGLVVRDRDGLGRASGKIDVEGLVPRRVELELEAEKFPVRQEGSILAALTGKARLEADLDDEKTVGSMLLHRLHVELPEDSGRTPQELEDHSDVVLVDSKEAKVVDEGEKASPIELAVTSAVPISVRGESYAAQIQTNLQILYADPDFRVKGAVEIKRGRFEVFGKRFDVNEGTMGFTGGEQLDPRVLMTATHELRSHPGETVTVTALGTLSHPVVRFGTTLDDCGEQGQVVSLLVTGQCNVRTDTPVGDSGDAGKQAMNFLAGVTAGVLTLSLREQFGRYLPTIVVESGDDAFRSARIRAAFDATDYLPEVLRDVVTGAMVEGSVNVGGTAGQNDGSSGEAQAPDVGFKLELRFPYDIVTTGKVTPGVNWGLDVTWEP